MTVPIDASAASDSANPDSDSSLKMAAAPAVSVDGRSYASLPSTADMTLPETEPTGHELDHTSYAHRLPNRIYANFGHLQSLGAWAADRARTEGDADISKEVVTPEDADAKTRLTPAQLWAMMQGGGMMPRIQIGAGIGTDL